MEFSVTSNLESLISGNKTHDNRSTFGLASVTINSVMRGENHDGHDACLLAHCLRLLRLPWNTEQHTRSTLIVQTSHRDADPY